MEEPAFMKLHDGILPLRDPSAVYRWFCYTVERHRAECEGSMDELN